MRPFLGPLVRLIAVLFSLHLTTGSFFAQTVSVAQVSGLIQDSSGAIIPGAQIKLTQLDTKLERQVTSDGQGRYVAPALPVGPYQLEVAAAGFKTYLQSGIVLQVGNNVGISVTMQVGANSERVDVTAEAGMVETRENTISQVIDQRRILELPLNGRQPTQLILLSGAAVTTPGVSSSLTGNKSFYSSTAISVAGGQGNSVNYLLDGGDNNDAMTNVNLPIPFPDALQEFAVQTSSLPARFGLHPGAVVNAVAKSGSNDWHGSAFEFLRNGDVNARNYFAPVHDSLKRNQFGGTFGGRVIRDKLFFFGGFQGTFNRQNPPQLVAFVPTAAVLSGDFSVINSSACVSGGVGRSVVDPTTGLPFTDNQISVGRFNQQALNLAKYLPVPQNPCGRVTYGIPTTGDEDQGITRIDWVQNSKHVLYGRYFVVDYRNPGIFDPKSILTSNLAGNLERAQSATIGDTYTFKPTLLNSFHFTFTRRRNNRGPAPNAINPQTLGINVPSPVPNVLYASVSGYFDAGCNACAPAYFNVNSFHFADDVDIIRGRHQVAFGGTIIRNQFNSVNAAQLNGVFNFNGQYASGKSVNDPLAAFLLGVMNDFNQSNAQLNATRETVAALYVQDSVRLTSRLTANFGLRWEPAMVPYEYFNQGEVFSQAAFNAGQRSTVFTNAPAGLLFYGDPGVPQGFQHGSMAQFSPRAGIVWDPNGSGRQTIRVSGAILRDTIDLFYGAKETSNPPFGTSVDRPFPFPAGTFSNPWGGYPGGTPFPLPSPLPSNFTFPSGGSYSLLPPNYTPLYMGQWNVSYQRQITPDWLASVSYIGNKTTHVFTGEDLNHAVYISGSSANTNSRRQLFLQNPALGAAYGALVQSSPNGNANYNGLLLSVQHRFNRGFTLLTNYTWSRCLSDVDRTGGLTGAGYMNPYNRAADYGRCNFDVRSQMNTSLVVISPLTGKGIAARIFGQWQLAPIVSARSGLPMNITSGADISQTAINLDRPNLVLPNAYASTPNPVLYLNRAAFQNAAAGTFGNLGRNILIAPGALSFDVALSRTFRFRERWQLTPRAEAFNVINHTNFAAPNTVLSNSQFGVITAAGDPRIFQFAVRAQF